MLYNNIFYNDCELVISTIPNVEELYGKTIAVTGATGLIGSAVVDLLTYLNESKNANITIYAGCRSNKKFNIRFAQRRKYNLHYLRYEATEENNYSLFFDYVIHAASLANPNAYINFPVETMLGNIISINEWLKYARRNTIKKILYISSSEVYGNNGSNNPYSEGDYGYVDILNPRACYPSAKRAAETLCASYLKEYGVNFNIVRPGHVYGPSATDTDNRASSMFIRNVIHNSNILMKSSGMSLRSYCYSFDCVAAILCTMINGEAGKAYNVSVEKSVVTIRDFAETLARISKKEVVFENPSDEEVSSYNLMDNSVLNVDELKAVGWKGLFDLDTGIKHTLVLMTNSKLYEF